MQAAVVRRRGIKRRNRIGDVRVLVAEYDQPLRRQRCDRALEGERLADLGEREDAALLRRLDDVRAHALGIDAGDLRVPRQHRLDARGAHLDRLLHYVVEPGVLERREHEIDPSGCRLRPRLIADRERAAALAHRRDLGPPFAVAAVEQKHGVAGRQAQHVEEIIGAVAVERHFRPGGKPLVDVKARRAEIVVRHRVRGC